MGSGTEDNIRYDASRLAKSNAELVARAVSLCAEYDRHAATADEARRIFGLASSEAA